MAEKRKTMSVSMKNSLAMLAFVAPNMMLRTFGFPPSIDNETLVAKQVEPRPILRHEALYQGA